MSKPALVVLVLLLTLFLLSPANAGSGETGVSKPTKVEWLWRDAIRLGGYTEKCRTMGCEMPRIVINNELEVEGVLGFWHPFDANTINVTAATTPGDLGWNETVVHEFVHFLQWRFGELVPTLNCFDRMEMERRAYEAGAAYLKENGIQVDYGYHIAMLTMGCYNTGL